MVALTQRVRKLEKAAVERSQIGRSDDRVVYQPSEEKLAEAVAILVECGAARQVDAIGPYDFSSATPNLAWNC